MKLTDREIKSAADRLRDLIHRTPVVTSTTIDECAGAQVFLKCENFQKTGSFKFRGASHAIARLDGDARRCGVITYSSGNHAQALACAGKAAGVAVTVVMPTNAPEVKAQATRGYGAEVITYDPATENREEIGRKLADERGLTLIPPYDHDDVIAGQGTAALELIEQVDTIDAFFCPCGGGGLLSGCVTIIKQSLPHCRVIGVEPELADDATRSFQTRELQTVKNPQTIADGLRTPCLGDLTFPIILDKVDEMVTVTEHEIVEAMRLLWERTKMVVEPSGAVSLAGLMKMKDKFERSSRVGVLISGGNVDLRVVSNLFASNDG